MPYTKEFSFMHVSRLFGYVTFHPGSNSEEVAKGERKLEKGFLENFKKLCDIQGVISHLFLEKMFANGAQTM